MCPNVPSRYRKTGPVMVRFSRNLLLAVLGPDCIRGSPGFFYQMSRTALAAVFKPRLAGTGVNALRLTGNVL